MAFKRSSNSAGGLQATFDSGTAEQKAAFQASVSGGGIVVAAPSALGWDQAAYPLNITLSRYRDGLPHGTSGLNLATLVPGWQSWPQLWVDVSAGTNGTGTQASPYNSIAAAVAAANTSAVPTRIMCKGGTTAVRNKNFSASGSVIPAVDLAFVAYGGRCIVGAHDAFTWTANATYAWVYQTSRTNSSRVVNLLGRDDLGLYPSLRKVGSLAECSRNPGTWYTDGTIVYVYRADGAAVVDANTRLFIATENLRLSGTNQYHCLLVGETETDGFDLEGGVAGAWRSLYTGIANSRRVVHHARNCTFRYSGHTVGAVGNVATEGVNGLCWFVGCDASGGATDCWNWHNVVSGSQTYALTEICTGFVANPINASYTSCNGWTNHDGVIGIDIAGRYQRNAGVSLHAIDTSKTLLVGTDIGFSVGDRHNGGGNFPAELKAEDTAKIWTHGVTTEGVFAGPRWRVEGTAEIYRNSADLQPPAYVAAGATLGTWT